MNLFLYFLLAHFLADYPFQPRSLVAFKMKSFWGVLLHTFIYLVVMSALLLPFWGYTEVRLAIGIMFVTHTAIDQLKCMANNFHPKSRLAYYVSDQLFHYTIIAGLSLYIGLRTPFLPWPWAAFYLDQSIIFYALILVVCTFFWDVTRWIWRTRKEPAPYKRDYQTMAWNTFVVSMAFAVYWMAY